MTGTTRRRFLKQAGRAVAVAGLALAPGCRAETRPADPAAKPPNILLVFPDQHRGDWGSWNPAVEVRTPHLDALAARGARFAQALCPSPLCAPSRACLASGKAYDRCRVASNRVDYPLDAPTFYQALRDAGYQVAGCGKFDLHKASHNWGTDGKHLLAEWGFTDGVDSAGKWDAVSSGARGPKDPYMAYLAREGLLETHVADMTRRRGNPFAAFPTPLPEHAYGDNWVGGNGLALLEGFPREKPWLLQVNFPGPHSPWDITERMHRACRDLKRFPPPVGQDTLTPQHLAVRQNYSAMIENIDRWLGLYLDAIGKRGETARTLVVYSSDHGEMLGDHGQWGKSKPRHPSVHVPMVVAGPSVAPGRTCDGPATTLDLTATFLEAAGLAVPGAMDSRSLAPLLRGKAEAGRRVVTSGLGAWRLAYDGRLKLITRRPGGRKPAGATAPVLYDLANDPHETKDVAAQFPDDVARLARALEGKSPA